MKKVRIRITIVLIVTLVIALFVCGLFLLKKDQVNGLTSGDRFIAGTRDVICGQYYFFEKDGVFCYRLLDSEVSETLPIFNDVLADGTDNPFPHISGYYSMLVASSLESESEKAPVLVIAHGYIERPIGSEKPRYLYRIVSFDMSTQQVYVIKDSITSSVQSLSLYKDRIFFTTNEGDLGYDMHTVQTNGTNYRKIENANGDFFRILYAAEGRVYCYKEGLKELYSCDIDLNEFNYLFNIELIPEMFVNDGFIYYSTNHQGGETDGKHWVYCDLYRRPLSDISKEELLLSKVTVGRNEGNKFYFYSFENAALSDDGYDAYGTSVLYAFDLKTKQRTTIYDFKSENVQTEYVAISDKYLIYWRREESQELCFCINLITKEETRLM
ncbi:MAG: hypothetical protein IJC84_05980 [Clostridia bacterium]|nr:hypothetical protein [Clostridia bacterium]